MPLLTELQDDALALGIETENGDGSVKTKAVLTEEIAEARKEVGIDVSEPVIPEAAETIATIEDPTEPVDSEDITTSEEDDEAIIPLPGAKKAKEEADIKEAEKLPTNKRFKRVCEIKGLRIISVGKKSATVAKGQIQVSVLFNQPAKDLVRTLNLMGIA